MGAIIRYLILSVILDLTIISASNFGGLSCAPYSYGQVPHPVQCDHYIQCRPGQFWMTRPCPAGTLFDANTLRCNHASLVTCYNHRPTYGVQVAKTAIYPPLEPPTTRFEYSITKQWDSKHTGHAPIIVTLAPGKGHVIMTVKGPFFNDPPNPGGQPGEPFPELWNYEVAEAFFLADDEKYLEVEICPHGQHLVLLLNGRRNAIVDLLPMKYSSEISNDWWVGRAEIPAEYFPPDVTRFNAYAIHGSDDERMYEALYPAPRGKHEQPDFHRLEYFQPIDFPKLLPENEGAELSDIWKDNMK